MKAIKITLWLLMVLVVLAVGAIVIVTKTVDPNDYKPQIEKLVLEKTGRALNLEGDLALTFFPWIGVETGKVSLAAAEGFGDLPMIEVNNAEVRVKLMPLVRREVEVDTVVLDTPRIRLATDQNGVNSWDDLMPGEKSADDEPSAKDAGTVAALAVQGVSIKDGMIEWDNRLKDQTLSLNNVNLDTGRLVPGEPLDVSLSLDAAGSMLPESGSAAIDTTITLGEQFDRAALANTKLDLSTSALTTSLEVDEARYAINEQTAAVRNLDGTITQDGQETRILVDSLDADIANMVIDLPEANITRGDDRIFLTAKGAGVDAATRNIDGRVEFSIDDPRKLLAGLGLENVLAAYPDTDVRGLNGGATFNLVGSQFAAQKVALNASVNNLATTIAADAIDYNVDTESLALPALEINQDDFSLALSANGKGLLSGGDARAANGSIDLKVADMATLIERNGISLALPSIPLRDASIQTNFALNANNLATSRLAASFAYQGQPTSVSADKAAFNISNGSLSLEGLQVKQGDASLAVNATGANTLGELEAMQVSGNLAASVPDVPGLLARNQIDVTLPEGMITGADMAGDFSLEGNALALEKLKLEAAESTITGTADITNLASPSYAFDLDIDALDIDRLTSAGNNEGTQPTSTAEQILLPVAPLQGLNVDGRARVGTLVTTGLTLNNVDITIKSSENVLRITPLTADAFGGRIESNLRYDVSGQTPVINVQNQVAKVDVGDLLTGLEITDKITGTGNLTTDLVGQGADVDQLVASLAGDIGFEIRDGAIKGYDLQATLIQLEKQFAAYKGRESSTTAQPAAETKFAELSGSFKADRGVFRNNDLEMKAPLFRVNGGGEIGLPKNRIDYDLNVNVVETVEGQGGAGLDDLRGARIPLKIYGPLTEPKITLDLASLLKEQAKKELKKKVLEELLPGVSVDENDADAPSEGNSQQNATQEPQDPKEALEETLKKELKKGLLKGLGF